MREASIAYCLHAHSLYFITILFGFVQQASVA